MSNERDVMITLLKYKTFWPLGLVWNEPVAVFVQAVSARTRNVM
jgi:hypothetical protein